MYRFCETNVSENVVIVVFTALLWRSFGHFRNSARPWLTSALLQTQVRHVLGFHSPHIFTHTCPFLHMPNQHVQKMNLSFDLWESDNVRFDVYVTMPFPFIKWKTKLHKIVSQKFWWVKLWLFFSAIIQCNPPALIEWKSWLRGMGNVLKLSGSPLSNPLSEAAS